MSINLRTRYSLSSGTDDGLHLVTLTGHNQTLNMPAQAINSTKHCTEPTNIDKISFKGSKNSMCARLTCKTLEPTLPLHIRDIGRERFQTYPKK